MDDMKVRETLRHMAKERAIGELRVMLQTYYHSDIELYEHDNRIIGKVISFLTNHL